MDKPETWKRELEARLQGAIRVETSDMADRGTDFPWLNSSVISAMARAAVNVLEAVADSEQWLVERGGLDKDWIP
jgi:hypothetical protein